MKVLRTVAHTSVMKTFALSLSCLVVACGKTDKALIILEQSSGSQDATISTNAPKSAAVSLAFDDTSERGGVLGGSIKISRATDESSISHYVVYWGSDDKTKLLASPPIATLSKGAGELVFNVPNGTAKPINATHILVRTKNQNAEMSFGPGVLILDKGVPSNWPTSLNFRDENINGGKVDGLVSISRAFAEDDLSHYVLYWSADSYSKLNSTPIAVLPKTGTNLSYALPKNTALPDQAKYMLVVTKNSDGEMGQGVSTLIFDRGVPVNAATSVAFTDNNTALGKIGGEISISRAANESDITHYTVYFGSNASTKLSPDPIATIAKTGQNLTSTLPSETIKPANATHLLVFSKNIEGEMAQGVAVPIADKGAPVNAAVSVAFTDDDLNGGRIGGKISISKAVDESDITHYVVYFGSGVSTKQSATPIATIAKTGQNISSALRDGTIKPANATHLLVYTKNQYGETIQAVYTSLIDKGIPINAASSVSFSDTNLTGGKLDGDISIVKAANESDLTHYVVYFGSNASTKQSMTPIATIAKTGQNLVTRFPAGTDKPKDASHLLVFTKNADGEMATGAAVQIIDKGVPVNAAVAVSFTDTDLNGGKIAGNIAITKAVNESDVTHYVVYFGSDSSTKQSTTPLVTLPKTGTTISYWLPAGTNKPANATHLLVFTKNADGENATSAEVQIIDKGVPVNAAASVSFTNVKWSEGKISGDIVIRKSLSESDITHYVVYFGSSPSTKQGPTSIVSLAATGKDLTFSLLPAAISPLNVSNLLVFTKNADGEMATGVSTQLIEPTEIGGCRTIVGLNAGSFSDTFTNCQQNFLKNSSIDANCKNFPGFNYKSGWIGQNKTVEFIDVTCPGTLVAGSCEILAGKSVIPQRPIPLDRYVASEKDCNVQILRADEACRFSASRTYNLVFTPYKADGQLNTAARKTLVSEGNCDTIFSPNPTATPTAAPTSTVSSCNLGGLLCTDAFTSAEIGLIEFGCPLQQGNYSKGVACPKTGKIKGCQNASNGTTVWAYSATTVPEVDAACKDLGTNGKLLLLP